MNKVLYFSCTKQSESIALYLANVLNYEVLDLTFPKERNNFAYETIYQTIILCFPIHSQNIPDAVKYILKHLKTKYIMILATHGKMGTGNVLLDAQKLTSAKVIGAALIPARHSYKDNGSFTDFILLEPLILKLKKQDYTEIKLLNQSKNVFADILPLKRSQWGVKIIKKETCTSCHICQDICPMEAIDQGIVNGKCIRCLSCVMYCPEEALAVKISLPLKNYLKKDRVKELKIFI